MRHSSVIGGHHAHSWGHSSHTSTMLATGRDADAVPGPRACLRRALTRGNAEPVPTRGLCKRRASGLSLGTRCVKDMNIVCLVPYIMHTCSMIKVYPHSIKD